MPITITPTSPTGIIGPNLEIKAQSSLIGALPSTTTWIAQVMDLEATQTIGFTRFSSNVNPAFFNLWGRGTQYLVVDQHQAVPEGTSVRLQVDLHEVHPFSPPDDTGFINVPIHYTPGLADMLAAIPTQAGLTDAQQAQLTDVQTTVTDTNTGLQIPVTNHLGTTLQSLAELLTHTTLDQFVNGEVTAGETADPVRATIGAFWYSIVVQVLTIPDVLAPQTPDENYYLPDLAVVRIIRGTDTEFRAPVHMPDQEFFNPLHQLALAFAPSSLLGIPTDFTLAVDWRFGCSGRVFLKVFP